MARLSLSKQQLAKERRDLAMYRRYLPSLDLKRKQLMSERAKVDARLAEIDETIERRIAAVGAEIPMLADAGVDLKGLVTLKKVKTVERNFVGVRLPTVEGIEVEVAQYGYMTRPHWVDLIAHRAEEVLRLEAEKAVARRQKELLDKAVTKVMQRVNLFEKVLIPHARDNIRRISIALGDRERAAVVNSKIAKKKREAAAA